MVWDRDSANIIHHIRTNSVGGVNLSCLSWNHGSEEFIFATGSQDGSVQIWTDPGVHETRFHSIPSIMSPQPSPYGLSERSGTPRLVSHDFKDQDFIFQSHARQCADPLPTSSTDHLP
jgi:WD40 repeat protein